MHRAKEYAHGHMDDETVLRCRRPPPVRRAAHQGPQVRVQSVQPQVPQRWQLHRHRRKQPQGYHLHQGIYIYMTNRILLITSHTKDMRASTCQKYRPWGTLCCKNKTNKKTLNTTSTTNQARVFPALTRSAVATTFPFLSTAR